MAEIEITLPTVQYGNAKVRATPEELGVELSSPAGVGTAVAVYLNLFTQGFKLGSALDVTASPTEGLKAPVSAPQGAPGPKARTVDEILSDEDVDTLAEARAILDRELGGVTEVSDPHGPGGSHNYDPTEGYDLADRSTDAPWDQKVDAKPKPWETDAKEKLAVQAAEW